MASIILIGFMAAGKSTVGKRLAQKLNLPFVDLDDLIVEELGETIASYFSTHGEAAFREVESQILAENMQKNQVIATGGGVVTSARNRRLLQNAPHVFYLTGTPEELLKRLKNDQKNVRPLALKNNSEEMRQLHAARHPWYIAASNFQIDTTNKSVDSIVEEIYEKVGKA